MSILVDAVFDDLDRFTETVRDWDVDFRLLDSGGFSARIKQLATSELLLSYARFGKRLNQAGGIPNGYRTFGIPGPNCSEFWWRGQQIGPNDLLIFPLGSELRSVSHPAFEVFVISVKEDLLERISEALKVPLKSIFHRGTRDVITLSSERADRLRSHAVNLLFNLQDGTILHTESMQFVAKLVSTMGTFPAKSPVLARKRDIAVDRVVEFVRLLEAPSHDMATLCQISAVSERTLQYGFRERYGISPSTFVKRWKLNTAQRMLSASNNGSSVGDVASKLGFWHQSQFSSDYRRLFGELPSQTLRSKS